MMDTGEIFSEKRKQKLCMIGFIQQESQLSLGKDDCTAYIRLRRERLHRWLQLHARYVNALTLQSTLDTSR